MSCNKVNYLSPWDGAMVNTPAHFPAVDTNTIFRGNTMATKCMEQLMHTVGGLFLHDCLDKPIAEIAASKLSCEVDPSKVLTWFVLPILWAQ